MDEVRVRPLPMHNGDVIEVRYNGLLAKSGADQVYLHTGLAYEYDWTNVQNIKMNKEENDWVVNVELKEPVKLKFCFKDSANNWDNNNGRNWSYTII